MVVRLSGQRLPLGSHHLWVPNPSCHHCFELTLSHNRSKAMFCRAQECSTTAPSSISLPPCQQLPGWTRVPSSPKPQHRSHLIVSLLTEEMFSLLSRRKPYSLPPQLLSFSKHHFPDSQISLDISLRSTSLNFISGFNI